MHCKLQSSMNEQTLTHFSDAPCLGWVGPAYADFKIFL
jgi:hypothetical protein